MCEREVYCTQAPAVCHDRRRDFRQRGDSALSALESRGWFSSTLRVRTYQFAHRGSELYLARASFANKARSLARSRRSPGGLEAAMRLRGGVRAALSAPSFEVEQARTNSQAPAVCNLQPELVRATSCRALGSATRARPARFVTERRAERSAMSLVRDLLRDGEEVGLQERGLQGTGGVERKQMHAKRLREDLLRVKHTKQAPCRCVPSRQRVRGRRQQRWRRKVLRVHLAVAKD